MTTATTNIQAESVAQLLHDHILQEIAYDRSDLALTNDFQLIENGIIDSMGILRVVTFLEEKFAIEMDPHDLILENFATIDAITSFVVRKLAAA